LYDFARFASIFCDRLRSTVALRQREQVNGQDWDDAGYRERQKQNEYERLLGVDA